MTTLYPTKDDIARKAERLPEDPNNEILKVGLKYISRTELEYTHMAVLQDMIDEALDTARAEGYEQGYNDGHEQQLKMRILDQKELKKGNHAE